MTDQVERKKSYRWASASQASYDGAGWDSSDEIDSHDEELKNLPTLPKLDYTKNDEVLNSVPENTNDPISSNVVQEQIQPQVPELVPSFLKSQQLKRTPTNKTVNDDLDNLMEQISKEMTPVLPQGRNFEELDDRVSDKELDNESDNHVPREYFQKSMGYFDESLGYSEGDDENTNKDQNDDDMAMDQDEEEEFKVSKNGYFSKFIENENESKNTENKQEIDSEVDVPKAESVSSNSESRSQLQKQDNESKLSLIDNYSDIPDSIPENETKEEHPVEMEAVESTDDTGVDIDELSYTESITNSINNMSLTNEEFQTPEESEEEKSQIEESQAQDQNSAESSLGKDSITTTHTGNKSNDTLSIASSKDTEPEDEENVLVENEKDEPVQEDPDISMEKANNTTMNDTSINAEDEVDEHDNSRDSTESGEWRPNTDAFRSGFVQETDNKPPEGYVVDSEGQLVDLMPSNLKQRAASTYTAGNESVWQGFPSNSDSTNNQDNSGAPEGYVYDEDGKLVNLTPSAMKSSAISTYTAGNASMWEAFPSDGTADIETIRDTKTIYDNNTLFNVPGVISNNTSLPPLPDNAAAATASAAVRGLNSSSTLSTIPLGLTPIGSVGDISKLKEKNPIPQLDLNQVIGGKRSNAAKLEELRNYRNSLEEYDTGVKIWISHSLKSSNSSDSNFIFEEYKVSKHVKHAYANADELSKKSTVINTVDTVTQNVSHLKKKVFSHSIKSKGLFASIGKKKL
ncbi:hypothetical protein Kpol_1060p36 [Vanderwaltozyma polyspora DSM 70294]|uniref:Protein FYV8 n=1 Tax=Vanderwaltozyma polyspora (strain ATCC 22028 / DSM 70294 / BCRC 21397 / CBS 2163 / NBRC 10782 / NRRL Y-8283 / UCD 57-17) TaxID=436907 RepID=A7TK34_VANPO|nr:uncharacterized protein Kpol_1060p36 [Vanderwaltozyma polyspora DSM 70294]EDO17380.1 hypothetical protein Kpol_1060p36 [Vanderwaltozyma polyspora DSM 70294]